MHLSVDGQWRSRCKISFGPRKLARRVVQGKSSVSKAPEGEAGAFPTVSTKALGRHSRYRDPGEMADERDAVIRQNDGLKQDANSLNGSNTRDREALRII